MPDAEHVVDDLEALVSGRVVYGSNVGYHGKLGGGVVLEELKDGQDARGRDVDRELVFPDTELLDEFRKA